MGKRHRIGARLGARSAPDVRFRPKADIRALSLTERGLPNWVFEGVIPARAADGHFAVTIPEFCGKVRVLGRSHLRRFNQV
jgi:hypothetical protein